MITNIRLELSDSERNDLAKRIYRDSNTNILVTRKEVTEVVHAFIKEQIDGTEDKAIPCKQETKSKATPFTPSRGDEDYLTQPKDPGVAAACRRILADTALIEGFAWETIERNRK